MEYRFNNGDKVKDTITGLDGIITSRADHLYGCNRYWIQPQGHKDGEPHKGGWFDEDNLEIVEAAAIKQKRYRIYEDDAVPQPPANQPLRRAGGPSSQPSSQTRQTDK